MAYDPHDTIVALATPPWPAARGIVRVSGSGTLECLAACFKPAGGVALETVSQAQVLAGQVRLDDGGLLPCDLYLWPDERSYTREPVAELHSFGSVPLLEQLLAVLCGCGARLAEPGEFTLRAFLAGRIDLPQAEAVLGVIDARGKPQLETALGQLAGGLSRPLSRLRDALLDLLAHLEAGLDFADEEIEFIAADELDAQLAEAEQLVSQLNAQMENRSQVDGRLRVVLLGAPNAGKSSLFNALLGGRKAIVSSQPGTTRDYLTARLELNGVLCELVDTAGVDTHASDDFVSAAAQARTAEQEREGCLRLFCLDASRPLSPWERSRLDRSNALADPLNEELLVLTKCDEPRQIDLNLPAIETSSRTGQGLDALKHELARRARHDASQAAVVASTADRCRESLRLANRALLAARQLAASSAGEELVAIEVRTALDELGKVVGAVYTDDVLDRIFSRFCIGK